MNGLRVSLLCSAALLLCVATVHAEEREGPPGRDNRRIDLCASKVERKPKRMPKSGQQAQETTKGRVRVLVVDENNQPLGGFNVEVDGKESGPLPPSLALEVGNRRIVVKHADVGEGCQTVKVQQDDNVDVVFQFIARPVRVKQLVKPAVLGREVYGKIAVLNNLGVDAEILVEPVAKVNPPFLSERPERSEDIPPGCKELENRVMDCRSMYESRGTGSLEISNLVVGCYKVALRGPDGAVLDCRNGKLGCVQDVKVTRKEKEDRPTVVSFPPKGEPASCR